MIKSTSVHGDILVQIEFPKNVGFYKICERLNIYFPKKPNFLHRFMSKLLLGWEWIDCTNLSNDKR